MDDPAQEKEPENARQDELDDGDEQTPLKQLPQSGNENATQRRDDVSRRSLSCQVASAAKSARAKEAAERALYTSSIASPYE